MNNTFPLVGTSQAQIQQNLKWLAERPCEISVSNGRLLFRWEKENEYDSMAVAVAVYDPESNQVYRIGYVPKKWCPMCGNFVKVADRDKPRCTTCQAELSSPMVNLNEFLIKNYIEPGKQVNARIKWIGGEGTTGIRIRVEW